MQKFIQTAMFYLLVSVLIMMAGIIFGYLWSSDIGLWIHDAYYGGGVSVSTIFTVIGTAFTVLTFGLALKAYDRWRDQFILDRHQRLVALHGLMAKLVLLNIKYQRALIELRKNIDQGTYFSAKETAIDRLLEYEEVIATVGAYDDLLLKLADDPDKAKTFALQYSLHAQIQDLIKSGKKGDIDFDKFEKQRSLLLELASVVGAQVYKRITESANKLPS